jgi:hypothetical protein
MRPHKPTRQPRNAPAAERHDRWSTRLMATGAAVVVIAGAAGAPLYFHLGRAPDTSEMPDSRVLLSQKRPLPMPTRRSSSVHAPPPHGQYCISPKPSHSASYRTMKRRLYGLNGLKLLPPNCSPRDWCGLYCLRSPVERTRRTQLCRGIWRTTKLPSGPCLISKLEMLVSGCSLGVRLFLFGGNIL